MLCDLLYCSVVGSVGWVKLHTKNPKVNSSVAFTHFFLSSAIGLFVLSAASISFKQETRRPLKPIEPLDNTVVGRQEQHTTGTSTTISHR